MSLAEKYDVPGPRYTSYPTVPYWDGVLTEEQWLTKLVKNLAHSKQAALYVHIPFCEALCTYCGCNTRITRNHAVGEPYVKTLLKEWNTYQTHFEKQGLEKKYPLSELHLGGGTPTFLSPYELQKLVLGLLEFCEVSKDAEFSLEADPRVTTFEHLKTLNELGFRRLSLGIQDFDPKVQEIVHRTQSVEQVHELVLQARNLNYSSINFDLIYGLPFQNEESIRHTIDQVVRIRPDRIAFYAYAHVPWIKPSQRRFTEADLPVGNAKRHLYEVGRKLLENAGYREVGMDHFALESDSLFEASSARTLHRNFMGYIPRLVSPLLGLGVSAISDAWTAFAQNEKVLETYQDRVQKGDLPILRGHILNDEDLILRRHILNLMTCFETEWNSSETHVPYLDEVPTRLNEFASDGLIELCPASCRVTEKGKAYLRNICMAFDARLTRKAPTTSLFSKTI